MEGQYVRAFDKFEDGEGIWACGYKIIGGNPVPTVWVSNDNGVTWNTKDTPSSLYFKYQKILKIFDY